MEAQLHMKHRDMIEVTYGPQGSETFILDIDNRKHRSWMLRHLTEFDAHIAEHGYTVTDIDLRGVEEPVYRLCPYTDTLQLVGTYRLAEWDSTGKGFFGFG